MRSRSTVRGKNDRHAKVNTFGWKLKLCEPDVEGWRWQISATICAVATVWEGSFSKKSRKNCSQNFQVLRLQAVITLQWLQMPKTHGLMVPLRDVKFSFLPLESLQSLSPGMYAAHQKETYSNFRLPNVHCLILSSSTLQCWCGLVSNILKNSRLNWKLKVSNTADNAGITQSQARDTRYHRMQERNSLCISK